MLDLEESDPLDETALVVLDKDQLHCEYPFVFTFIWFLFNFQIDPPFFCFNSSCPF